MEADACSPRMTYRSESILTEPRGSRYRTHFRRSQLPLLATSGCSGHAAGPTALPLRADLRAATSAFLAWRSALPRTADAAGRGLPRPVVTLCGHSLDYGVQKVCVSKTSDFRTSHCLYRKPGVSVQAWRAVIDACRPYHWRDQYPKVKLPPPELWAKAKKK